MGADKANGDYYLFSKLEKPGPDLLSEDYTQERFKKVKTKLGISQDHTLYAFKQTRGIHLYEDTKDPIFIMKQFRHKDWRQQ